MSQQYRRRCSLVVSVGERGLDLSQLRIQFRTRQADVECPNTVRIRVWNLAEDTSQTIQKEYQQVSLQAGYEGGNFGAVFIGTIKQVRRGWLSAKDSYLDIYAADGDEAYQFAVCSTTLARGSKVTDEMVKIFEATQPFGVSQGSIPNDLGTGGTLPRGQVLFGLAREKLSDVSEATNTSWSIQNGKVNVVREAGYLPGQAVVLNAGSSLIGRAEQTEDGIEAMCLLNPLIKIATRVQINNAQINQAAINQQSLGGFPTFRSPVPFFAAVNNDGFYRVLVAEHEGDTRGEPWYTRITALTVDASASPADSVRAAG